MTGTALPISLAGSQLGAVRHVCAFFSNDDEEYRVLLPFIKEGLERDDKAIHVVNPQQREEHLRRLASAGIDSAAAEQAGQLEIKINTEAYLRDGEFDQDRMRKCAGGVPAQSHRVSNGLGGWRQGPAGEGD